MTDTANLTESIFAATVALANTEERGAYLDQACRGDEALRGRVEALLRAHDRAGHLLDRTVPGASHQPGACIPNAQPGDVIAGRYKLLEAIGEGGMGAVWVAEQTQPVRRKVALKLIKPGMDSKSVLARFEAERQALAVMDHPNIAKVLDGGLTETGRPFFVMEFVKGLPITEYCDATRLSVPERLNLFVQVCQAVQHAHQKGIIHRDLKPSNILVAPYDDKPVPKVIDFGLAKAMHQSLTELTLHTGHETVLGTPLYMSPEQTHLNNLDVDTRTDIYSLGVLLYELLTGTTPLEIERVKQVAFEEMKRLVREEEPPPPSTRLSSSEALPSLAAGRHTEPARLTKLVHGELDWIVMKALEKDRTRRYETANGFAMDIERFLKDEPVEASPPSPAYRFRKFARRNRRVLSMGAMVIVALLTGTIISTWQAIRATQAIHAERELRQQAGESEAAARESERVAVANLKLANQYGIRADRYFLNAREVVDRMTERLKDPRLLQVPEVRALRKQLLEDLLECYQKVYRDDASDLPGLQEKASALRMIGDIRLMLGEPELAEKAYRDAISMRESYVAEHPTNLTTYQVLATCYAKLGDLMAGKNRTAEAEADYRRALVLSAPLATDRTYLNVVYRDSLRTYHQALFNLLEHRGQVEAARAICGELLAPFEESAAKSPEQMAPQLRLADALYWGTFLLTDTGHAEEADKLRDRTIDLYAKLPTAMPAGQQGVKLLFRYLVRIRLLTQRKRWAEMDDACHRIAILAPDSAPEGTTAALIRETESDLDRRACSLRDEGRLDDAIAVWKNVIELDPRRAATPYYIGLALTTKGDLDGAERAYREAVRLDGKNHGDAIDALVELLVSRGNMKEAIATYQKFLILAPNEFAAHEYLLNLLTRIGDKAQTLDVLRGNVAAMPNSAMAHHHLAVALQRQGQNDEAIAEFQKTSELSPDWEWPHQCIANIHVTLGLWQKAASEFTEVIRLKPDRWEAWSGRALANCHRQQWDNAVSDYSKAIELAPQVPTNWLQRGQAYLNLEQWDKAAADFAKVVERWPNDPEGWYSRGVAYSQLDQPDKAVADLRQAIERGLKDAERIKSDARLAPLRSNDDFKKLLTMFEKEKQ